MGTSPQFSEGYLLLDKDKLLRSLFKINSLLVLRAETNTLLRAILDEVVSSIGFDRGIIRLLDESGQFLEAKVVKNYSPAEAEVAFSFPLDVDKHECIPVRAVKSGQIIAIQDVLQVLEQITEIDRKLVQIENCGAVISAPLKIEEEIIGVITAWKKEKAQFLQEDIDLFLTFATQISVVIKNARLHEANNGKIEKLMILQKAVSDMNVDIRQKDSIRKITMDAAVNISGADIALVYLWDVKKNRVDVDDYSDSNLPIEQKKWTKLAEMAKDLETPLLIGRGDKISLLPDDNAGLVVPLNYPGRYSGFLYASKKKGFFTVNDLNLLEILVQNATTAYDNARMHKIVERKASTLKNEVATLKQRADMLLGFHNIIGNSEEIRAIFSLIESIAIHDTSVLITGESGTGKELVARAIHRQSPRAKNGFVEVNCSAIPSSLLESELFGHEAGAFTDARKRKMGLMEYASGGTLLLDEIGEMDMPLQAKFLRVLEDAFIRRIGGLEKIPIDVRFIFATNRDLGKMVEEGLFREDLFYRINVVPLRLPPLRERNDDIMLLAEHFLSEFNKKFYRNIKGFKSGARAALLSYNWPGNIRELRNVVERAIILKKAGDSIGLSDLPVEVVRALPKDNISEIMDVRSEDLSTSYKEILKMPRGMELKLIEDALAKTGGNKTKAAELLGISRYQIIREQKKIKNNK
ncbi:MAG: sigma 54-interacting transcriptional regulator [Deltaproteobacteria bacterium]|nr:sigma 54-interacting transcriptional regulator [Deltaproteobacteria bacterium]